MRFLSFLEGTSGIRGFLVGTEDGEELHVSPGTSPSWAALRAAQIAKDFSIAGAITGLGAFNSAAVRATQSLHLLAQNGESITVIDLDPTRSTSDIETQLQNNEWTTIDSSNRELPSSDGSDHDTLPPQAGLGSRAAAAPQAVSVQAPAPPLRPPTPVRPFQGLPAIAGRAVPRPNSSPSTSPLPRATPAATASSPRPARPPLPARAATASAAVPLDAPSEGQKDPAAPAVEEHTASRRIEPVAASSAMLTGSLATFALPDLLEFLRVGQRSGTLVCTSEAGLGAIHIKRGRITGAASPGVPSIGDWLVQRRVLSQEKLHEALRHHTQAGTKTQLGATLLAHRLISHEVLQEALLFHVGAVLRKLMTWESGAFTFDPAGPDAVETAGDIEIEPQTVLLNIFKEMDDSRRA